MSRLDQLTRRIVPSDIPCDETYRAHMLYAAVGLTWVLLACVLIYGLLYPPPYANIFQVALVILIVFNFVATILLQQRRWHSVILLEIIPLWIGISYGALLNGGIYASLTILYVAPLTFAVLMLNTRVAIALTMTTILYLGFLVFLELTGIKTYNFERILLFRFTIMVVILIAIVTVLIYNKHKLQDVEMANRQLFVEREMSKIQYLYSRSLSHDLRTPLSIIKTQTYLIRKRSEIGMPICENLQEIEDYVDRLTQIVNDFAQISELTADAPDQIVNEASIDLNQLVREAIDVCRIYNAEKNIHILFEGCTEHTLWGDSNYLRQMLEHLLKNSIQYGRQDGYTRVKIKEVDDNIIITVEDNGIGISKEQLDHIFHPFYRANEARTMDVHTGVGVGLAIARRIIQLHNGSIDVQSEVDKGSTFTVRLPIVTPEKIEMS